MPVKLFIPQRIALIDEISYAVAFKDNEGAMMCLRKNPERPVWSLKQVSMYWSTTQRR